MTDAIFPMIVAVILTKMWFQNIHRNKPCICQDDYTSVRKIVSY